MLENDINAPLPIVKIIDVPERNIIRFDLKPVKSTKAALYFFIEPTLVTFNLFTERKKHFRKGVETALWILKRPEYKEKNWDVYFRQDLMDAEGNINYSEMMRQEEILIDLDFSFYSHTENEKFWYVKKY